MNNGGKRTIQGLDTVRTGEFLRQEEHTEDLSGVQ